MKFSKDIHFPGTVDEVRTMMLDPAFRNKVSVEVGGMAADSTLTETPEGLLSVNESRPALDDLPSFARPFIGDDLVIHQEELWTADDRATLTVRVPGKPGGMDGTITLTPAEDGTTQTTEAEIKVNVPLFGPKVEVIMGKILGNLLKAQGRIGADWLAGSR